MWPCCTLSLINYQRKLDELASRESQTPGSSHPFVIAELHVLLKTRSSCSCAVLYGGIRISSILWMSGVCFSSWRISLGSCKLCEDRSASHVKVLPAASPFPARANVISGLLLCPSWKCLHALPAPGQHSTRKVKKFLLLVCSLALMLRKPTPQALSRWIVFGENYLFLLFFSYGF